MLAYVFWHAPADGAAVADYEDALVAFHAVPSLVTRNGVERVLDVPMSAAEIAGLRASAEEVGGVARSLGL